MATSIKDMHYQFKLKWEKVGTNQARSFVVPEIDSYLNEALTVYVRNVAEPNFRTVFGFELAQRTADDIAPLVTSTTIQVQNNVATLPENYWYFISGRVHATKDGCEASDIKLRIQRHNDVFDIDTFDKSSFEWREVNAVFEDLGILIKDADFEINSIYLTYIKRHPYMHAAELFNPNGYILPSGDILTGYQDCLFGPDVCSDIVDIAVLIASHAIKNTVDTNQKTHQLRLKQLQ